MKKTIFTVFAAAAISIMVNGQITDNNWSPVGTGMDPAGSSIVNAITPYTSTTFYAGGSFTSAGGVSCGNIALWNGTLWNALSSGTVNGTINALAPDGNGGVYVGGTFTTVAGLTCNNIVHYDGLYWNVLGTGTYGTDGTVYSIIPDGVGGIYIGGRFTVVDGTTACNNIARWDGANWQALSTGITRSSGDATVFALEIIGSNLYAGGNFDRASWIIADNIAMWDGSSWSTLGSLGGMNAPVFALETDGSNLFAGGSFTGAGGSGCNYIARWTGSDWNPLGGGVSGGGVTALAYHSAASMLYVGGSFTIAGSVSANCIARWTGADWEALGSGTDNSVSALHIIDSPATLIAGGRFLTAGGQAANNIAQCSLAGSSYTVTFVAGANGAINGTTTQTVPSGGSCTEVTAVPDGGYYFDSWTGTLGFASTVNPLTVTNVTYDMTITANFLQGSTYTVNFIAGTGGTISGITPQTIPQGSNSTEVTAVPDSGYTFVEWQSDLGQTSTANPLTVTNVVADQTWTASFTNQTTYTVNFIAGTGGTLTGTTTQTVVSGGDCTDVTAVPDGGYSFVNWTSNIGTTLTLNPIHVTLVLQNQTWTANFASAGGNDIFLGAVFDVPSTSVGLTGTFNRKPGVRGTYVCPISLTPGRRATATIVNSFPNLNATAKWTKNIKLYNKRLVTHPISTWLASTLPADLGLDRLRIRAVAERP